MKMFDSIYGEFVHKDWVQRIIVTPVMQRLRWIALSNVPSLTYPMISGVSRYAHSIGVSHLADILSDSLYLNETDRKNLICAGLLHDAGMPPLGHLTEEVLASLNINFDHENSLKIILFDEGRRFSLMPDGEKVGLTEAINRIHADSNQIFDAIIGNGNLGQYVTSSMDIDNIDNVIRLYRIIFPNQEGYNPEQITRGYFVHNSNDQEFKDKWDHIRERLYTKLMFSIDDFQQKATMKRMIKAYFLSALEDKEGDISKVVDKIRFINDSQFFAEILRCISNTQEHCSFYSGK
ncbi:MAG: HD domain-containing protein, partial [Nitrosomonas ureae]